MNSSDSSFSDIAHPEIGDQFTEIFIKSAENVNLGVGMLAEYDFKIRYPAVKLITNLLTNRWIMTISLETDLVTCDKISKTLF